MSGRRKPSEVLVVLLLAGIQFSHIMDFMVMMPLGPQLMRIFEISAREFGLVVSVYTFAAAISCLFAAVFVDRYERKRVLMIAFVGLLVGTFLCGLAPTFHTLLAARALTGLFGGVLQAIVLSYVGDVIPVERRGRAIGVVMAGFAVASVVGVPAGLWIASKFDWHAVFLSLAGLMAFNVALAGYYLPTTDAHAATRAHWFATILGLFKKKNTWLATAVIVSMMTIFALFPFISPFLVQVVGLQEADLSTLYLFSGLASFIVTPLAGRLSDRVGAKRVLLVSAILAVPAILALAYLGPSTLLHAAILNTLVAAIGAGRMTPIMTLINASAEPQERGAFMTVTAAVQQICAAGWSYIGGWILGSGSAAAAASDVSRFPILGWLAIIGVLASAAFALLIQPLGRTPDTVSVEPII